MKRFLKAILLFLAASSGSASVFGQISNLPVGAPELAFSQPPLPPPAPFSGSSINAGLPPITIDELVRLAMDENPTISQASMRVRAMEGSRWQAGLLPNPTVGYIGDEMGNEHTAGQQGGFLRQEIVTNGKRRLSRNVADHDVSQAEYSLQMQRQRVTNDVRVGAYELMIARRAVDLNDRLVGVGQASMTAAEKAFAGKEVSRADVLQAKIELNAAKMQLENSRNRQESAWRKLASAIGTPSMEPRPIADELERFPTELNFEASLSSITACSPEMAKARCEVERARAALARECAERVPNLDVEGGLRYNNASRDSVAMVQVGVPIQIFNRNQGNIAKAQSELSAASYEVKRTELDLRSRLSEVFARHTDANGQVRCYQEEMIPDAKKSLEIAQFGYTQGELSYLALLTAQRTYYRVNLDYLEILQNYWTTRARIEGMLLEGGLSRQ